MKSIRRTQRIISLIIMLFIAGMAFLVLKINHEADFYMMNSDTHQLGFACVDLTLDKALDISIVKHR